MTRLTVAILCSVLSLVAVAGQTDAEAINQALAEAGKIKAAILKSDYQYVINRFPEPVLKHLALKRKTMIKTAKIVMENMNAQGLVYESYKLKKPKSVHHFADTSLIIIPTEFVAKFKQSRVKSVSFFVAVKYKGDNSWYFLDGVAIKSSEVLKAYFKGAPDAILLPTVKNTLVEAKTSQ